MQLRPLTTIEDADRILDDVQPFAPVELTARISGPTGVELAAVERTLTLVDGVLLLVAVALAEAGDRPFLKGDDRGHDRKDNPGAVNFLQQGFASLGNFAEYKRKAAAPSGTAPVFGNSPALEKIEEKVGEKIEPKLEEVMTLADRIVVMSAGKALQIGPPQSAQSYLNIPAIIAACAAVAAPRQVPARSAACAFC